MERSFDGLGMHLGNLSRVSKAQTRSISAENPDSGKGRGGMATDGTYAFAARELGRGWKIAPCINIAGKSTVVLADILGLGAIQHIWMTTYPQSWRGSRSRT